MHKSKANNKPGRHKDKGNKYRLNFRKRQGTDDRHRADGGKNRQPDKEKGEDKDWYNFELQQKITKPQTESMTECQ